MGSRRSLGTSLGRLAYQQLISSAQYEAGRQFSPGIGDKSSG